MRIAQALDFLHANKAAQFESLSDLIPPELITSLLGEEGVATLRHRRMPMVRLVWVIIGMAIFRHVPMTQLVNQLDILLSGDRPFVAPSAFLQARQKLGDKSIERLVARTPDHSLTLFDKGFYFLGLLHAWQNTRWCASWGVRMPWCVSKPAHRRGRSGRTCQTQWKPAC